MIVVLLVWTCGLGSDYIQEPFSASTLTEHGYALDENGLRQALKSTRFLILGTALWYIKRNNEEVLWNDVRNLLCTTPPHNRSSFEQQIFILETLCCTFNDRPVDEAEWLLRILTKYWTRVVSDSYSSAKEYRMIESALCLECVEELAIHEELIPWSEDMDDDVLKSFFTHLLVCTKTDASEIVEAARLNLKRNWFTNWLTNRLDEGYHFASTVRPEIKTTISELLESP